MCFGGSKMGLMAVLATFLCAGIATAQSQSSCTSVIISMAPCLNYISGNSSTPSSSCCSQLSSVVTSKPECLCQVLNGDGSSSGITINKTQALQLPKACNVQTPPISNCNSSGSPAGSSDSPTKPTGTGTKTVPSTDGNSSEGTLPTMHFTLLVVTLIIASYAST